MTSVQPTRSSLKTDQTYSPTFYGPRLKLGPFTGGLHNSSGNGEYIDDAELFELVNLEVDTDGSLVNRPEIFDFAVTGVDMTNATLIGTYLPTDGRQFIVANCPVTGKVSLINASTGALVLATTLTVESFCCIQYANKLWVIPSNTSPNSGGFFDVPTPSTVTWTATASIPKGEAVTLYRERIWVSCGLGATTNTSRFFFSAVGDPTVWNGTDFIDVVPGNGQKLVSLVRLGNDLVLFKEHSTHRFTYTVDPRKAELTEVDSSVGVPALNCIVVYDNNTIYVLHDNSVYEMFQYTYTRISELISMTQVSDLSLYAKDQYGLTLHRDRLFVRYYKNLYVYALKVKRWSTWETTLKFSKVVVVPSSSVGLDSAFMHSATSAKAGKVFRFQDNRQVQNTTAGGFTARVTTKTYDFGVDQAYKVLFWWGQSLATSGNFTAELHVPNLANNITWDQAKALYGTWSVAQAAGIKWSTAAGIVISKIIAPTLGTYARKFIKLPKKVRFRQLFFTTTYDIISNGGIADASLRVYDLTVFIKQKEGVVRETS